MLEGCKHSGTSSGSSTTSSNGDVGNARSYSLGILQPKVIVGGIGGG